MKEQKSFMRSLADFMVDVPVTIVDEREGLVEEDLGELLHRYIDHCVEAPLVSLERTPSEFGLQDLLSEPHGIASLLGIFGNLMSCTVAHYLIISHLSDNFDEQNVAGDDAIGVETDYNESYFDKATEIVGEYERSKCFYADEIGAICLKRPISTEGPRVFLHHNVVPPTSMTAIAYVYGHDFDPRFQHIGIELLPTETRYSMVGIDLLRFLRSVFASQYVDLELVVDVFCGFERLVRRHAKCSIPELRKRYGQNFFWPVNPRDYDFFSVDPIRIWCMYYCGSRCFRVRENRRFNMYDLRIVGDVVEANWDRRLGLLEKLDYLEKSSVTVHYSELESSWLMFQLFTSPSSLPPVVHSYRCIRSIPEHLFWDVE